MKKIWFSLIVLSVVAVLGSACAPKAAAPVVEASTTAQPAGFIASGRVEPAGWQAQSFAIPGQVAEVLVQEGEPVKAGQVLARLNASPEASLALARAKQEALAAQQAMDALKDSAALNLAQSAVARIAAQEELDKAQTRFDNNDSEENKALLAQAQAKLNAASDLEATLKNGAGIDPAQMDALEARLASAQAALASAQSAVDAAELKATIGGTVANVQVKAGDKVTVGQPLLTVVDFTTWVVKTDNLTEVDVVSVKVGQPVSIVLDALPGQTLAGEVTHINMLYEEKRGDVTYTVTSVFKQTDPQMRWGMTAAVQFVP